MRRMTSALAGLVALGILAGCAASTKLTHVWTEPTFQANSLQKLMVIGIAQKVSARRTFENAFVAALQKQGIQAVASYSVVGEGQLDSAQVVASLIQNGCDGAFVTRLVDKKTVETYYPPTTTYVAPVSYGYGGWYGYYSTGYAYQSSPGYTVENQVINLETNLYRISDAKLVWSALSQSWLDQATDPMSEIAPFVQQLVYSLESSKVVTKSKKK